MDAIIISFEEAKIKRELKKIHRTNLLHKLVNSSKNAYASSLKEINTIIKYVYRKEYQQDFTYEYNSLLENLETKQAKFKFPTILSGYRKDMNPIDALYQNLQEALFKYDKDNPICVWIIELFKDEQWLDDLIYAIRKDYTDINNFQHKHYRNEHAIGYGEICVLQNIKTNYAHYIEVFSMMKDWED